MSDPAPPDAPGSEPTILVVDDDRDWVLLMELALMYDGFRVAHAFTGEDALSLLEQRRPDAVVLDISLPGIDGWGVLQRLAGGEGVPRVPVVVVSGQAGDDAAAKVAELGGRAYLPKPCRPLVLTRTVRSVCRLRRDSPPPATGVS